MGKQALQKLHTVEGAQDPRSMNRAELLETIAGQLVPRLVLAHAGDVPEPTCPTARPPPTTVEVAELAQRSLETDFGQTLAFVEALCRDGVSRQSILLDLLAPAAKLLGEQWLADEVGFTDVTIGLATIHQLLHALTPTKPAPLLHRGNVALVTAPREQHTLGIYILGELVRQAGWGVYVWPNPSEDDLVDLVSNEPLVMVGISVSSDDHLPSLAKLVAKLKRVSRSPDVTIMLGGALDLREHADAMGARYGAQAQDVLDWLRRASEQRSPS